jgi:hypothetical protein
LELGENNVDLIQEDKKKIVDVIVSRQTKDWVMEFMTRTAA